MGHDHTFGTKIGSYVTSSPQLTVETTGVNPYMLMNHDFKYNPVASLFATHTWDISEHWMLRSGLNLSTFFSDWSTPVDIQPRVHASYTIQESGLNFRAGYGRNLQYMHNIQTSNLLLPADRWFASSSEFPSETADQFVLGMSKKLPWNLNLDVDSYYRFMENVVDNKAVPTNSLLEDLAHLDNIYSGTGRAFGLEFLLRRDAARSTGWLAYSFGKSTRQIDELNKGLRYPFDYDRTHSIKLYLAHKFSKSFELSANWNYGTGYPLSMPVQAYAPPSEEVSTEFYSNIFREVDQFYHIPQKNNVRFPDIHLLSLGVNWYSETKNFQHIFRFMIYNVYSRLNVIAMQYDESDNKISARTSFPILPFLSYTVIF